MSKPTSPNSPCKAAKPDPTVLARRLFEWEMRTVWDTFFDASETYAMVLGAKGLAVYYELARVEWAKQPALGPGQFGERFGRRLRPTRIMESLARRTGDVEAVIDVKKRDLSSAYSYLRIAETYRSARKLDQAVEWAEKGVKAFPTRTDGRLMEFLADQYHRLKRHDDAMDLIWKTFVEHQDLERYQSLARHGKTARQWPKWRSKAVEHLDRQPKVDSNDWTRSPWRTELVRVYLWENKVADAWRAASAGGCSDGVWRQLAEKREQGHPRDAVAVYQRLAERTIAGKNPAAYREAIGLIRKVEALLKRLGATKEFADYLRSVHATHKAKRKLMAMMAKVWRA